MALLQTIFYPLYGFGEQDKINKFIANTALDYGKIVIPADTTGILSLANDYGYFLFEEVTTEDPLLDYALDIFRYKKKASATTAVTVLIPKKGNIVRTKWVSKGDGADPAVGQKLNISNGVYVTVASNGGTKGEIQNVYTDSFGNILYDVVIL